MTTSSWTAAPLVMGSGPRLFEIFMEPTCPYCVRTFGKLESLLQAAGEDKITIRIWLLSQPWHLFSGIVVRCILAASTLPSGQAAAFKVMAAVAAQRENFEFEHHRGGPNLDTTPRQLIDRIEGLTGLVLQEAFAIDDLDREIKRHTKYARQNGAHVSPTFMIDGLVAPALGSGDPVERWAELLLGT